MKSKIKLFSVLCLMSTCFTVFANCDYVSGQVLIKMKANKTSAQKTSLKTQMKANSLKTFQSLGIELWDVSANNKNGNIDHIIEQYKNHPDVEYIEPNYRYDLSLGKSTKVKNYSNKKQQNNNDANDPLFNEQWHLDNLGLNGGVADVDINAPEAWGIITESPAVKVAILDSGIDWKHEDLAENIWQNLGEDADGDGQVLVYENGEWIFDPEDENGIDDDGNGYIDDFVGWDFVNDDNNPYDDHSHGTHVAGIVGAVGNNTFGIAGVSWNVEMAALKMISDYNWTTCDVILDAIQYSTQMGFLINNCSWRKRCENPSLSIPDAIATAEAEGYLYIVAAGNETNGTPGKDNDTHPSVVYPATYPFENIISVASIDNDGALSYFSHYGATSVDIAAPGRDIFSTLPFNNYGLNTGTSMAAPQVAAACALLWQLHPEYDYQEIKEKLINNARLSNTLTDKCVSGGWLDLYSLLSDNTPTEYCIPVNDSLALVALYNATGGENWSSSWNFNEPFGNWDGVTLNASGCVSELDLSFKNLNGVIPSSIEDLEFLVQLNLSSNNLIGNLPPEIGNLEKLVHLQLQNNKLVGYIPSDLLNLELLQTLRLQNNQFIGKMPVELTNLDDLTTINLSNNRLQGCYTSNLKNNNWCSRFNNSDISNGNNFNTSWINFCNFNEGICNGNGSCSALDRATLIDLHNTTNGANWTNTWDLSLSMDTWHGVTLNNNGCVERLDLKNNNLIGEIPPSIGNLNSLVELQLWANFITGGIPEEIGNLLYLNKLVLTSRLGSAFQLGGTIPSEIGNLKNLEELYLNSNSLTGNLPTEIGNLVNIKILSLFNNALDGAIPPEIGKMANCQKLELANNQLTGNIPNEIGNLKKLTDLTLQNNELNGDIPTGLGNLISLVNLSLYANNLSGNIPPEIGQLVNIVNLSLDDNSLTGTLPKELGYLPDLGYINVENNILSGCYESALSSLCNINTNISNGNSFINSWDSFCNFGTSTCDWVWPGDFDSNGIVDEVDALFWGLADGFTGPPRDVINTEWERQYAPNDWLQNISNVNSKHQDANGDGIVNSNDVNVITSNFGKQHGDADNFSLSSNTNYNYKLKLVEVDDIGDYNYDIFIEDLEGNPISINGLAFHLNFSDDSIGSVQIKYQNYDLEADYLFEYFNEEKNTFHAALFRADKTDIVCDDAVARVVIIVAEDNVPTDGDETYFINSNTIQANGDLADDSGSFYPPLPSDGQSCNLDASVFVNHVSCSKLGSATAKPYDCNSDFNVSYYWSTGETTPEISDLTPGVYELTVSNSNGESVTKIMEIGGSILPVVGEEDCIDVDTCPTLVEPYTLNTGIYQANRTIKSNDVVPSNTNVIFKAGDRIRLDTGFSTKTNTTFKATIEDCQ